MNNKWFRFSYFNIKNLPEDSYDKEYNEVYQNNKKDYFKVIIKWLWEVPHIPFEGIEFVHMWNQTNLVFSGTDNNYWLMLRESNRYDQKGKWCFKVFKTSNDHCSCC